MIPVNRATPHTSLDRVVRSVYVEHPPAEPALVNGERVHGGLAYDPDMPTHDFLEWLERDARAEAYELENTWRDGGFLLPVGFTDMFYPRTPRERREANRIEAAMRLSCDIDTLRALLSGKAVPRQRLRKDVLDTVERMKRG